MYLYMYVCIYFILFLVSTLERTKNISLIRNTTDDVLYCMFASQLVKGSDIVC